VVGVVGDVRSTAPNSDPPLMVYLPPAQNPPVAMKFVLRTAGIEPPIRQAVKDVDPLISLGKIVKVDEIVSASTAARRFQMILLASFAIVALLLACLGIYGVVSFSVAQRRSELGLRIALGAQTRDIASLVLKEGMKPVLVGVVMGLLASLLVARLISSLLFGVTPIDPATYALAATILLTVAAAACWIPARNAVRIDPIATLRCE
jgi:putative ABC transport system permease protein